MNKFRQAMQREEGFTLIELMIVMVVLGILTGIVLFAIGTLRTDAEATKTTANAKQCATAKAAAEASVSSTDTYKNFLQDSTFTCS